MKKLATACLGAVIILIGVFIYWISTVEPHADYVTTPPLGNSSHALVAFSLGFPSPLYGRFVRLQDARYIDAGVRYEQEKVWGYEILDWGGTREHEDTLSGLVNLKGHKTKRKYIAVLFKLRDGAYVSETMSPLELDTGPYTINIQYKVLWFSRSLTFTHGNPVR